MFRVVKIGGSLLQYPDLADRVAAWQQCVPAAKEFIVVGGGATIDAMRDLYQRFALRESDMHWRCVRLLRANFEVAGEIFPHWNRIATPQQLQQALRDTRHNATYLILVEAFYYPSSPLSQQLPESWHTTSDSIAAGLANQCGAAELHLLKSCDIPSGCSLEELARRGIVDRCLPAIAGDRLPTFLHRLKAADHSPQ